MTQSITRKCAICGQFQQDRSRLDSYTYFYGRGSYVKIGVTNDPQARFDTLDKRPRSVVLPDDMDPAAPLEYVGMIFEDAEHFLHEAFGYLHVKGEWFRMAPEIVTFLHGEWRGVRGGTVAA